MKKRARKKTLTRLMALVNLRDRAFFIYVKPATCELTKAVEKSIEHTKERRLQDNGRFNKKL